MVGALAEQVDRDHGPGLEAALLRGRDAALERGGIDVEGRLVDIDEHRRRADQRHRLAGRAEREGRAEHRVARADFLRHQHHQQRIGAAGAAHDMLGAAEMPQAPPPARDFRPVDELAMVEHAGDGLIDRFAEPPALRGDVDEGNGFWTHVLVHGALLGSEFKEFSRRRGAVPCARRRPRAWRAARGSGSRFRGWRRLRRR